MPDRENVIKGLALVREHLWYQAEQNKQYRHYYIELDNTVNDAISLLNEQEAEMKRLKGELHGIGDLFHTLSEKTKVAMAEQQKVVMCLDCKLFNDGICELYGFRREDDYYCADGVKREGVVSC